MNQSKVEIIIDSVKRKKTHFLLVTSGILVIFLFQNCGNVDLLRKTPEPEVPPPVVVVPPEPDKEKVVRLIDFTKPFTCTKNAKNHLYIPFTYANWRELMYLKDSPVLPADASRYSEMGKFYVNDQLVPGSGPVDKTENTLTCSQDTVDPRGSRGCVDDPSVPIVHVFDMETLNGSDSFNYGPGAFSFSLSSTKSSTPPVPDTPVYPTVVAIKLVVGRQGGYSRRGGIQLPWCPAGACAGAGGFETVISRCKGQFEAGGRESIGGLEKSGFSAGTQIAGWEVDYSQPIYYTSAQLRSAGKMAEDGYISNGVYYLNVRLTQTSTPFMRLNVAISAGVPAIPFDPAGIYSGDLYRAYEMPP